MTAFNYNNRTFKGVENYHDGDLNAETRFHYHQEGNTVWGTFEGGNCTKGTLVARVLDDGRLAMMWQYLNNDGQFHSGTCTSTPEILPDGRYRLHEEWQLIGGTQVSGKSVIEEIK